MGDPIKDLYDLSIERGVLNSSITLKDFTSRLGKDDQSKLEYLNILKEKQVFKEDYTFEQFNTTLYGNTSLQPSAIGTVYDKPRNINKNEITEDIRKKSKGWLSYDNPFIDTSKLTFRQNQEIDKQLSEEGIEDISPSELGEIKEPGKDKRLLESAKNVTNFDRIKYAVGAKLQNASVTDLVTDAFAPPLSPSKIVDDIHLAMDANLVDKKLANDVKSQRLAEHDTLLSKRLDKLRTELGGGIELEKFEHINDKFTSGVELSPEETDFYNEQLSELKNFDKAGQYLQALQRRGENTQARKELEREYKDVYLLERIKKERAFDADDAAKARGGFFHGLYNVGQVFNHIPAAAASSLYTTGLTLAGDVEPIHMLSTEWNADYWQRTTKESRPTHENIAEVQHRGQKFEVAFNDEGVPYAAYVNGYEQKLTDEDFGSLLKSLGEQNPSFETERKSNSAAKWSQGFNSMTDIGATILLTYAGGAALKGLTGTSALGKLVLSSPRLLQSVPVVAQFTGMYAEQGIKDGGITNPLDLALYAVGGAFQEYLTELINPLEGRIAQKLLKATSPIAKFNRHSFDLLTKGDYNSTIKSIVEGAKNLASSAVKNTAGEIVEEFAAEGTGFIWDEVFNDYFDSNFENENPLTVENLSDVASITAMATLLPIGVNVFTGSNKSALIGRALHSAFKAPDLVEAIAKQRLETKPEEAENVKKFLEIYNTARSKSSEYVDGTLKGTPIDFGQEVFARNYEIASLENNPDKKSRDTVEELKNEVEQLNLKAKYGVYNTEIVPVPKDKAAEVLSKVEEELVNLDMSKLRGSTKAKLFDAMVSQFSKGETELKGSAAKAYKKAHQADIDKDIKDSFIAEINKRVEDQRQKGLTLNEIRDNLKNADDLKDFKLPKAARDLYVDKAVEEKLAQESNDRLAKERETLRKNKETVEAVGSKLGIGDTIAGNASDIGGQVQYKYKGVDSTGKPIIEANDGTPLYWSNSNNTITFEELNDALTAGELNIVSTATKPTTMAEAAADISTGKVDPITIIQSLESTGQLTYTEDDGTPCKL